MRYLERVRLFRGESKRSASEPERASARPPDALERASKRIEEICAATDRAIGEIRADTERLGPVLEPASDREQIILQLLSSLTERAERLDEEARQLAGVLARAGGALAALEARSEPPAGEPAGASAPSTPAPEVSISRQSNGPAEPASEGVRLLATQMVVAGSSRDEIEARLRDQFEIEDADALLDEILGSVSR